MKGYLKYLIRLLSIVILMGCNNLFAQTTTLADNGTQVSAGNVNKGATNHIILKVQLSASGGSPNLSMMQCFMNGTAFAGSSISALKLWYSTDNVLDGGDTQLGATISNPTTTGLKTFNGFSQSITSGSTRYFFFTADIKTTATLGQTISPNAIGTGNFSVGGTKVGSSSAPGTQTIVYPSVALANNGSQVSAGNVAIGATDHVLHQFSLTVTSNDAELTGLQCITAGTYASSDLDNLKIRYSTDATLDAGDATLSTYTSVPTASTLTFPSFTSQTISTGTTGYIFITADISASAVASRTIYVSSLTTSHLTFTDATKSGSTSAGGAQTIQTPSITLANNGSQVGAASIAQGTNDHILHKISLAVATAGATLTGMQCITAGTYISSDIVNLKVRYSTDNTLDAGDATLSTYTTPGVAGTKTFPSFTSQLINSGTTGYIFITCDIFPGASAGRTINVNAVTTAHLTFVSGTKGGSSTAGGAQTFSGYTYTNIYPVTSTSDAGAGTLRQAIADANGSAGRDYIYFNLGGAGPYTITLTSSTTFGTSHKCALTLSDNSGVTIDGFTNVGNYGTANSVALGDVSTSTPLNPNYKVILTTNNTFNTIIHANSNNNVIKGMILTNYGDNPVDLRDVGLLITGNTNKVLGCMIGTNTSGTAIGGSYEATCIYIQGSSNEIGDGTTAGANLISGTAWSTSVGGGIRFENVTPQGTNHINCSGNSVKGNIIGLQINGTNQIPTGGQCPGISMGSSSPYTMTSNNIGGTSLGDGNVISGNSIGIRLSDGTTTNSNTVYGNIIGPAADGITYVTGNRQTIGIDLESRTNTIGGNTAAHRNIISGNEDYGIRITGSNTYNNVVKGNYIGPGSSLASVIHDSDNLLKSGSGFGSTPIALGSSTQDYGIYILNSAYNNTIGGVAAGESNVIAHNTSNGIYHSGGNGNRISGNLIYTNVGLGIDLVGAANSSKTAPTIDASSTITLITGTSGASNVIEVFENTTLNDQDAVTYLGTTTANGAGNWSLAVALNGAVNHKVIATARDGSNNTSEFSGARTPLPIELIEFKATCNNGKVIVEWTTASETNNDFFTIERTSDGVNNKTEYNIAGSGNTSENKSYSFVDNKPLSGTSYYRLKQTDFDGKFEYFNFVAVACHNDFMADINVYPNPNSGSLINLYITGLPSKEILVMLYDVNGKETFSKLIFSQKEGETIVVIDLQQKLAAGLYYITATFDSKILKKKIIVK